MNFLAHSSPLTPQKQCTPLTNGLRTSNITGTETTTATTPGTTVYASSSAMSNNKTPPRSPATPRRREHKHTPTTQQQQHTHTGDRFIPNRGHIDFAFCHNRLVTDLAAASDQDDPENPQQPATPSEPVSRLNREVLKGLQQTPGRRLMTFCSSSSGSSCSPTVVSAKAAAVGPGSPISLKRSHAACSPKLASPKKKTMRVLPSGPSKILDAPDLMDDYYLNLLTWGSNNVIAIALHNAIYLWHAADGHIDQLLQLEEPDQYVTSVQFSPNDNTLAVGTSGSSVQLWDASSLVKLRDLPGHSARVSSLAWNGAHQLSSGGRDSAILNHDLRQSRNVHSTYLGHQQEVCGLAWSPDGSTLASGGNENLLCLWDAAMSSANSGWSGNRSSSGGGRASSTGGGLRALNQNSSTPRFQMTQHQAAVKALAWCPFQRNVLASGGGTADRTIRLWNASLGTNLSTIDTGSQVCALQWSEPHRELVSSHGFSDNQLCLWKLAGGKEQHTHAAAVATGVSSGGDAYSPAHRLQKIREFKSHSARVLHLAKSPDGSRVVSAGADETLRFWDLFGANSSSSVAMKSNKSFSMGLDLSGLGGVSGSSFCLR